MNVDQLRSLITDKSGSPPVRHEKDEISLFLGDKDVQPDVAAYLEACLPEESYTASGLAVHSLDRIRDESDEQVSPGGVLFAAGYLVIATSIGGNAACVELESGRCYWADQSSFASPDEVAVKDGTTGKWNYFPTTPSSVRNALSELAPSLQEFLEALLGERLLDQLAQID